MEKGPSHAIARALWVHLLRGGDAFVFHIFPTHFSLALQVQFAPYPIKPADHTASHCSITAKFVYQFVLYNIMCFLSIPNQYLVSRGICKAIVMLVAWHLCD